MLKRLIASAVLLLAMPYAYAATCSVSEFRDMSTLSGGQFTAIPSITSPGPTTQTVTATTPVAVTNAFASGTRFLWINCNEVMHLQLGATPATGLTIGHMRIPANGFWLGLVARDVEPGTLKIAFCDVDCL